MARLLAGSDESTAFAWIALREIRQDASRAARAVALVREVMEARAEDLPLLLVADAMARAAGDRDWLVSIMSELAGALEGDREKGAVMWVLALMMAGRDGERAFSLAREAQEKLPTNPLAAVLVEQLATAREEWATAAMFARQAASITRQLAFGVRDYLRAGQIYRDRLGEDGWAVQCFEQAVSLDPTDDLAFGTLREHFTGKGEWDRVAALIEERILAVEEAGTRHQLLRELSHVYEQAGRREEAIASLRRVLAEQPEDPECLESMAKLCVQAGLWEEAVGALQERALLPMSEQQAVEVFTTLGGLYVNQLPNDQRAVVCYERALQAGGMDLDVVEELARLYEKTGAWDKSLRMVEQLYNGAESDEDKARWLVSAGRLWQVGGGDLRRAEQTFEMARKLVPGAAEPVVALVRLYRDQGDQRALSFHMERSLGDLQMFAKGDPGNLGLYHTVFRIAVETGVEKNIRVAGTLLEALFDLDVDEQLPYGRAGGRLSWSPGDWLGEPGLDEILAPPSFTPSFRMLVGRLRDVILKSVGYDPVQYGISRASRLQKRQPDDVGLLDETAQHLGVKPPQVHLTELLPNCLTVLPDSPPLIVIGEPLYRTLGQSQKRFAFAWGCKLAASGLVPFMSMTAQKLPCLWVALIQQFEASYFVSGVDENEVFTLSTSLRKSLPKKAREELFGAALECAGDQRVAPDLLHGDISHFADAAALLASGDVAGALQFVWQVSTMEESFSSDHAASEALRESPSLARLVEFIVSGRFARCLPEG
jgi:tetratricopeptide (TPR) repeat protein